MNKKINYSNSGVWLEAQRQFVERKDSGGAISASPLYQAAPVEKVQSIEVYAAAKKVEPLSWLSRLAGFSAPAF